MPDPSAFPVPPDDPEAPSSPDFNPGIDRHGVGSPASWQQRVEMLGRGAPLTPARVAAGVAAAVVALVVAMAVLRGPPPATETLLPLAGSPGDPALSTSTSAPTSTTAAAGLAHAAGAVHQPGVYRVPPGARVADLVEAAGGPRAEADLNRLNLAAPVLDGQQVYVPRVGEAVPPGAGVGPESPIGEAGTSTDGVVDLNVADAAALDTLPGVGPATAEAILDERRRRGRFASVEELLDVRGIGEAKLESLRDRVRV